MRMLITGASGRVGRHVVRLLAERHQVIATGRGTRPRGLPQRAEWRQADLADPRPWTGLLAGVGGAFLFPAFGHTRDFLDAAAQVGVNRLALLSSGAVGDTEGSVIKAVHAEIEDQATATGIPTVRVRPTVFMANDLGWLPAIDAGRPVPLAYPEASLPAVAEQDVAAMIAGALTGEIAAGVHPITGPRSLSQIERLEILSRRVSGEPARWSDITEDAERSGYPGMPGPPGEYLLRNLRQAARRPVPAEAELPGVPGRSALDYVSWVDALER